MEHIHLMKTYSCALLELHKIMAKNDTDSQEEDKIRETLENLWDSLSESEKKLCDILSGDLYMLFNQDMYIKVDSEEKRETLRTKLSRELEKAYQLKNENDIYSCLELLHFDLKIPRHLIALEKSNLYGFLGLDVISNAFKELSNRI